ncbi:tetratricopeptide repeat protein [Bacteroides sp. AN502]|nr:tetratricopeptide repeat protein [Caecibacteroides pullorum]MDC6280307.1 tetratricopeptide repeat protein [Caecibacteroides pullorum]
MCYQKYIGLFFLLIAATTVHAQKAERDLIRKGNRMYNDSVYENAEVNYRKALEINPKSTVAMYNLANTLMQQNKLQEAMEQFAGAAKVEKEKPNLAQIYHNMGVIFQSQKDYAKAIEAYKESLRNNPKDDETRYNLALAQKLLKDQQQDQQNQDNQQNQQKQEEKQDQQQNQQQNQNNDQQQEPPQQQKQDNQMSKENAEQLLNSVMQDEKDVQDKVKKQQQVIKGNRLEKDW